MIPRHLLTALLTVVATLTVLPVRAADNGVHSFTVSAPTDIVQGQPFVVTYTLQATHWTKGKPREGNGMMLRGVKYDKSRTDDDQYAVLTTSATYLTSRTGSIELPRMAIIVDGEEVLSETETVVVQPHPDYGAEMAHAHQWLVSHGQLPDSICLSLSCGDQDMLLFSDRYHPCFAVVARKALWPLVGEPVLAYGVGSVMPSRQESPDNYDNVMRPFSLQLQALKKTASQTPPAALPLPYQPAHSAVAPLLGALCWGQGEPYNVMAEAFGFQTDCVGCLPLATAMVMSRYQWPGQGTSHTYYEKGSTVYKYDFTRCRPDWAAYKPRYGANEKAEAQNLSALLVSIGLAIDANFRREATSATITKVKPALCANLHYSPKMALASELGAAETAAILYREIDNGRPCIVSHGSHAFVCDGYRDGFLHYNFGWEGHFNGYYRLSLGGEESGSQSQRILIKELIYGIEPLRQDVRCEVTLSAPGTLDQQLSQADKENATHLKVSGPLNSADIGLLRKMAGAPEKQLFTTWQGGALMHLDLSDATITTDTTAYLTDRAKGTWRHTETVDGVVTERAYDFSNMSQDDWLLFSGDVAQSARMGISFSRVDDHLCQAHYYCQADTVGMFMFSNCTSLQTILLPKTTVMVNDYAFSGCQLLQSIRLPEEVKLVGRKPFSNCELLERVEMPAAATCKDAVFSNCSPALAGVTRY